MINKSKNKIFNFLKWTEKWTKTDMVYLAKGGFWLSINQVFTTLSALLLSVAFANLIPVEKYGEYKFILSIFPILAIPTLSGMQTAINRAAAKGFDGVLMTGIKTSVKWGMLGGVASLFVSLFYYLNNNINLTLSFLIIAVFVPFMDPLNSFGSFLQGKKKFELSTKLNIVREIFNTAVAIISLLLTKNIVLLIFIYFISRTIIRFILLLITIGKAKENDAQDSESISIGKHYSLMGIIGIIAEQADKILVFHYLGATELAIYTFAMLPINQLNGFFFKNLSVLAFPKLSEITAEELKKTLPSKIYKYMGITLIISAFYIILAPLFFKLLFPQYMEAVIYSQFFVLSFTLVPFSLYNTALSAQGAVKKLYNFSFMTSTIKILLFMVLLPIYGIGGAIATILLIQLCAISYLIFIFKRI